MLDWLIITTLETSLLTCLVLLIRPLIRRAFGANIAYALWLIPAIGVLLPARPSRPGPALEAIRVPGSDIPGELYSAAEIWSASGGLPWIGLWLVGAILLLAVQILRSVRFRRKAQSTAVPFTAPAYLLDILCRYGMSPTRVLATKLAGAPFVTGLWNVRMFLPADFLQRFSAEAQRWIVIHELTHIRRKDLWLRLVAEVLRVVFWFNPLVHVAVNAMRHDQEYACDRAVVSQCTRQQRYEYGRALMLGAISEKSPAFITFFGNSKERYIMLGKHRKSTLNTALGGIVCTLIGLYSLSSSPVSTAQETEDSGYDLASVTRIEGELYQARFLADAPATLSIFAPDQVGTRQEWTVVLGDTAELRSAGFGMVFFAPGPGYTITGNPSSDPGERRLLATSVTRPDGSVWSR